MGEWSRWQRQSTWGSSSGSPGYSVSGLLTNERDQALVGKTVTLLALPGLELVASTTTTAGGAFAFAAVQDGSYRISCEQSPYSGAADIVVAGAAVSQNLTASASGLVASGYILDDADQPLENVSVEATGDVIDTQTTDALGYYEFTLLGDGTFTLTPTLADYDFAPTSREVTIFGASVEVDDFVGTQQTWTISGTVTGEEVEGVTVALSGDATDSTTTDVNGDYEFTGLVDGSYTLTPTLEGYDFTPASINVTIDGADDAGNDFVSAVAMLSLPYTYDVSTAMAAASDGDTAPSADANWVTNPSWSPWRVTGSGIADPDGYTPAGVTKMMYGNPAEGTYRVGRFALPQQVDALAGFRMAFLRRTTVSNAGGPFGQMKAFDGIPMDWTTAIPSISFSRSTDGTPKCYLETRYTTGGADQTEMNWASATDYGGGLTSTDGRYWSWTCCEMDFVNNTVKVRVKRASDDVSRYAELSQAMNANGAALDVTPKWTHFEFWHTGGAQDCLAKIWLGSLTDAWPT